MKILILSHSFFPFIGGIEVVSEMFCRSFTEAGHEIHLVTWTKDPENTLFPFQVTRQPNMVQLFRLHAWADVVVENNPALRLSWPAVFFNRPSVIVIQTWIARMDGTVVFQDKLKLKWLKRSTKVVAISESIRKACFPAAEVIGNPFRANQFSILSNVTREKDYVFLGRLVSDKGVDLAIKAIAGLGERCVLTIIGDGPEANTLKQLTIDLRVEDQVVFKGPLRGSELVKCLNEHRFMLIPSTWEEPFGIVALEGIACGCIPIVSDGGGLADAVGSAGVKFKRGDVKSLIECMTHISGNPQLESKLKDAAIPHLTNYRPEIIIKRYLDILNSIYK